MDRVAAAFLVVLATSGAAQPADFDPGRTSFAVKVRGDVVGYREFGVSVMPRSELPVTVVSKSAGRTFEASASCGDLRRIDPDRWTWTAPDEVGLCRLVVRTADPEESIRLNVFVMMPAERVRNGSINGYRIDAYPSVALKGLVIYKPPQGFIEVTESNVDTPVSPHFTLGQFLCKQEGGYPKYIVLRQRLLLKLELLLERVNAEGIRADSFHVMSGYRTPYYNRAIGNVKYSRHVYGGAADIFVDERPRDGIMDDLDGNGRIDVRDAGVLYDIIDALYGDDDYEPFVGGLGRYRTTAAHGPFVHVDVRGFRARWGD